MNIFGVYVPTAVIILIILLMVGYFIWQSIRRAIFRFQGSAYGFLFQFLGKALKEELQEEGGMDFKEYNIKEEIKKVDDDFDEAAFLAMVEDVFRKYCQAFSTNDNRLLKSFETDSLFQRHNAMIKNNQGAKIKEVQKIHNYIGARIMQLSQNKKGELTVEVRADMCRYKVNQNGSLISGSMTDSRKEVYKLKFSKELEKKERQESINCPNCGAPHLVHSAGICEYCGSMIQTYKDNWLLADINRA